MKYYMIPEKDIKELEKARKSLCNLGSDNIFFLTQTEFIRQPMYELTHRRYPIVPFPKLIKKLTELKLWKRR